MSAQVDDLLDLIGAHLMAGHESELLNSLVPGHRIFGIALGILGVGGNDAAILHGDLHSAGIILGINLFDLGIKDPLDLLRQIQHLGIADGLIGIVIDILVTLHHAAGNGIGQRELRVHNGLGIGLGLLGDSEDLDGIFIHAGQYGIDLLVIHAAVEQVHAGIGQRRGEAAAGVHLDRGIGHLQRLPNSS